ncbi:MAG: GAF and ANTAR domain-containing protein [Sporichthyaceae bacterium]
MSIASLDGSDPISSGDDLRELAEEFAALGASVFGSRGPTGADASDLLVRAAVQRVGGAESASITTLARDRFTTTAATDDVARAADEVQYQLRSGPCVDAVVNEVVFQVPNLSREPRWPEYARVATDELGIGSMLSFKLAVDSSDLLAGLNLYAFEPDAFDDHALHTGLLLATYGALLVNAAASQTQVAHLKKALESSREIGIAVGVLMSRYKVTREQAFDLLSISSQQLNRKVRELAVEVADIGELPSALTRERPGRPPG